jgi:hypothetical protein
MGSVLQLHPNENLDTIKEINNTCILNINIAVFHSNCFIPQKITGFGVYNGHHPILRINKKKKKSSSIMQEWDVTP